MELLWSLCLFAVLTLVSVTAYPECPNLSEETIEALNKIKVTEDVHEKLVGEFSEVWGPKEVIDPDPNTCIKFSRQRTDDKTLAQTMVADGSWFGGKRLINLTLEKVDDGVYLARKESVVKAVFFILYAQNNVVTHYAWEACSRDLTAPVPKGKHYVTFVTGVSVQTPLQVPVQAAVDEAVRAIRAHPELLGPIEPLPSGPSLGCPSREG